MSYVYFIRPKGMAGPIKIGWSNVPENRLATLGTWSPFELEIIGRVDGSAQDERYIHECLALHHSHREWFIASVEVVSAVNKIIAGGSVDAIRGELKPVKSIRSNQSARVYSDEWRLRRSYCARVGIAVRKARAAAGDDQIYRAPKCIRSILYRWSGDWPYDQRPPSDDELKLLDKFLSSPARYISTDYREAA